MGGRRANADAAGLREERERLVRYFRNHHISLRKVARETGFDYHYFLDMVSVHGRRPISDSARLAIARKYPETIEILLPGLMAT